MRKARIGFVGLLAAGIAAGMSCQLQTGGLGAGGASSAGGNAGASTAPSATASGASSSSTTSSGHVCMPGEVRACYDGDGGMPDAGACRAGTQSCNLSGSAYETSCVGEVTPMPDDCASGLNAHCEVPAPTCSGTPAGAEVFGGMGDDKGLGIAVDAQGNAVVTGLFHGTVDFGNGTPLSTPDYGSDAFVAKYDPSGKLVWVVQLGGNGDDRGTGVVVDATGGDAYVTGWFSQQITLKSGPVTGAGIYVARLSGADGSFVWSDGYVGDSFAAHAAEGIALGADGDVAVVGYNQGKLTIDATHVVNTTAGDQGDGFVLLLDGTGKPLWLKQVSDAAHGTQGLYGVAIDGFDGSVVVTGTAQGDVDFGNGMPDTMHGDLQNIAFAKYTKAGAYVWRYLLGTDGTVPHGYAVGIGTDSEIYMTGDFQTQISFNTINLSAPTAGLSSMFVACFHADGVAAWAQAFPGASGSSGWGLAVGPYSLAVGGYFVGTFSGGGISLSPLGVQDAVALKLTTGGLLLWARQLGGLADYAGLQAVAFDGRQEQPLGRIVATGEFTSQLDNVADPDAGAPADAGPEAGPGLGPFTSNGLNDVLVVRFEP